MSQRIGMDADLMRSPSPWLRFHQSRLWIPFNDPETRFRGLPAFVIHHRAMFMSYISAQGMLCYLLLPFWIPFKDCMVCLLCVMIFKLDVERSMSLCITRENHHATCDFVQAMNDKYFVILFFKYFDKILGILFPSIRQDREPSGFIHN